MKDGISAIKQGEYHQRLLERFVKARFLLSSENIGNPSVQTFCNEECCDFMQGLQIQFTKNGNVPQIIDIEYF